MSGPETKNDEQGLNDPKNNEELFDAINKAVSEGNDKEVTRLFEVGETLGGSETPPDATTEVPKEQVDAAPAATTTDDTPSDDPSKDSSETSATPEAAPNAASANANETPDMQALLAEINRLKSAAGRVDYLQARLTQLEREEKKRAKQQAEKPAETPAPVPRKSDEKLQKLKEIDPDMAETLEALREELRQEAEAKYAQAAPKQESADDTGVDLNEEILRLTRVHPDTDQILFGPGRPLWDQWKSSLTPEQRAWAESDRAEEVAAAMTAFKQAVSATQAAKPTEAVTTKVTTEEEAKVADSTAQARERKLRGSAGSNNPTIKNQGAPDVDKMFSEMYTEIQKKDGLIPAR